MRVIVFSQPFLIRIQSVRCFFWPADGPQRSLPLQNKWNQWLNPRKTPNKGVSRWEISLWDREPRRCLHVLISANWRSIHSGLLYWLPGYLHWGSRGRAGHSVTRSSVVWFPPPWALKPHLPLCHQMCEWLPSKDCLWTVCDGVMPQKQCKALSANPFTVYFKRSPPMFTKMNIWTALYSTFPASVIVLFLVTVLSLCETSNVICVVSVSRCFHMCISILVRMIFSIALMFWRNILSLFQFPEDHDILSKKPLNLSKQNDESCFESLQ